MKLYCLLIAVFITPCIAVCQKDPVAWSFSAKKLTDKTYEIHLNASIQKSWHIYSQHSPDEGALPTQLKFTKNPLIIPEGKASENGKIIKKYEDVFDTTVQYYEGSAGFVQLIKLKSSMKTSLAGSVTYMACNDHQCLPPKIIPFTINIP